MGLAAVTVALIIQSACVFFGAIGTPILINVNAGLRGQIEVTNYLSRHNLDFAHYLNSIRGKAAIIHGITGRKLLKTELRDAKSSDNTQKIHKIKKMETVPVKTKKLGKIPNF